MAMGTDDKVGLIRGLYMIFFFIISYLAWYLIVAISIFQFVLSLVMKKPNTNLMDFGQSLSSYYYEIMRFLSYNSEQKPYPFDKWPGGKKTS